MELTNTLYRVFNNKRSVDLGSLCISPGEHCWLLYVDVLVGCPDDAQPGVVVAGLLQGAELLSGGEAPVWASFSLLNALLKQAWRTHSDMCCT